jgi:hypothetical protein
MPRNFSSLMRHWRSCYKHQSPPRALTQFQPDGLQVVSAQQKEVEAALDGLYGTLSGPAHFNMGETYPIRIFCLPHSAQTLALITFLRHYTITFELRAAQPAPAPQPAPTPAADAAPAEAKAGD